MSVGERMVPFTSCRQDCKVPAQLARAPASRLSCDATLSIDVTHDETPKNSELRSCVKVEVHVLSSPSLIVRTVSVDVKQH